MSPDPAGATPGTTSFVYEARTQRVVFGAGCRERLGAECAALGCSKVALLTGSYHHRLAEELAGLLGSSAALVYAGAVEHTPVEVTAEALERVTAAGVDGLVALGGGAAVGLAKALAARTGAPILALPTTFAGSEMTTVLGEREGREKATRRVPGVLPRVVLYDPELLVGMPAALAAASGLNALAHCFEALWAPDANPLIDAVAAEGVRLLFDALPGVVAGSGGEGEALAGAFLAGQSLAATTMGLHHRLCHLLGGRLSLPHGATHAALLPHVVELNGPGAPALGRVVASLGLEHADEVPGALFGLSERLGAPQSLGELGLSEEELPGLVEATLAMGGANPVPLDTEVLGGLLARARARAATPREHGVMDDAAAKQITEQVLEQVAKSPDPRVRAISEALVRHLHAFIAEVQPTPEEWGAGIEFLTKTGQFCTPTRQEFVLLSDTLGVSSLVNLLNRHGDEEVTDSTVLGPFFVEGAPEVALGADISAGAAGIALYVTGEVRSEEGGPLAGALLDTWQSDAEGSYDVQRGSELYLRAQLRTDEAGRFSFWSVVPSSYPIPHDGPVGAMLSAQARHPYRPAHLHFKFHAEGHHDLVTHLFPAGDPYLGSDAVFSVSDSLIKSLEQHGPGTAPDGRVLGGEWASVDHRFVLARADAPASR